MPLSFPAQTCRGDGGCATRFCDQSAKKCGCPSGLVPSSSGTACDRILSSKIVKAINCGPAGCRCPDKAKPAPDGVGCLLEERQTVTLPQLEEPDLCFNNVRDRDESDDDCGGGNCTRRCGPGQKCQLDSDCTTSYTCTKVVMSRGANGTMTEELRCSCPNGRYMTFKTGVASCVRVQELCTNAQIDPAGESDVDW